MKITKKQIDHVIILAQKVGRFMERAENLREMLDGTAVSSNLKTRLQEVKKLRILCQKELADFLETLKLG